MPPQTQPSASSGSRVVVALSEAEFRRFFPAAPVLDSIDGTEVRWLSSQDLDAAAWLRALAELEPAVLVTGWSTPPLPEPWLLRPDCALRYVCHVTGSVRQLVPRGFIERGGLVSNWGGLVAASVAEHALLLALAALRGVPAWRPHIERAPAARRWDDIPTRTLRGARVGVHGFGAVARALVELLRPFGTSIRAYSAAVPTELLRAAGVEPAASLIDAFRDRDVVFECEALTPATLGSVGAEVLAALPDDAVFVNVGRGRVVDETALVAEAARRRLRVAVDVLSEEPATPDSPLCRIPTVLVSPHIAGPTVAEYPFLGDFARANVGRFLRNEPVQSVVTLALYDRAT